MFLASIFYLCSTIFENLKSNLQGLNSLQKANLFCKIFKSWLGLLKILNICF
jgi:hypothetical protein